MLDWQFDEPFSNRPAIDGSFIASAIFEDYVLARQFCKVGLLSNPNDARILNNLAVVEIESGNLHEAKEIIKKIKKANIPDNWKLTFDATQGMYAFRDGNAEEGKSKYLEAIEGLSKRNDKSSAQRALLYYARELVKSKTPGAKEILIQIRDAEKTFVSIETKKIYELLEVDNKIQQLTKQ